MSERALCGLLLAVVVIGYAARDALDESRTVATMSKGSEVPAPVLPEVHAPAVPELHAPAVPELHVSFCGS